MEYFVQIDGGGEIESYVFGSLDAVNAYFNNRIMGEVAHQLRGARTNDELLKLSDALTLITGGVGPDALELFDSAMRRCGYLSAQVYPVPNGITDYRKAY